MIEYMGFTNDNTRDFKFILKFSILDIEVLYLARKLLEHRLGYMLDLYKCARAISVRPLNDRLLMEVELMFSTPEVIMTRVDFGGIEYYTDTIAEILVATKILFTTELLELHKKYNNANTAIVLKTVSKLDIDYAKLLNQNSED